MYINIKYLSSFMPKVSVIIPCYNHGKYILDAINSVEKVEDKSLYELIIVNDGSTDEFTNKQLQELADKGYTSYSKKTQAWRLHVITP